MSKKAICAYCGGTATLLCDYRLGWERLRTKMEAEAPNLLVLPGHDVPMRYRHVHTCDTPLCEACTKRLGGPMFICLRGGNGFVETQDYCPDHDMRQDRGMPKEISGMAARLLREKWQARARARWSKAVQPAEQASLF